MYVVKHLFAQSEHLSIDAVKVTLLNLEKKTTQEFLSLVLEYWHMFGANSGGKCHARASA